MPFLYMVLQAIHHLSERKGSTPLQICKYIQSDGSAGSRLPSKLVPQVIKALKIAERNGLINKQSGRYRLIENGKLEGRQSCIFGWLYGDKKKEEVSQSKGVRAKRQQKAKCKPRKGRKRVSRRKCSRRRVKRKSCSKRRKAVCGGKNRMSSKGRNQATIILARRKCSSGGKSVKSSTRSSSKGSENPSSSRKRSKSSKKRRCGSSRRSRSTGSNRSRRTKSCRKRSGSRRRKSRKRSKSSKKRRCGSSRRSSRGSNRSRRTKSCRKRSGSRRRKSRKRSKSSKKRRCGSSSRSRSTGSNRSRRTKSYRNRSGSRRTKSSSRSRSGCSRRKTRKRSKSPCQSITKLINAQKNQKKCAPSTKSEGTSEQTTGIVVKQENVKSSREISTDTKCRPRHSSRRKRTARKTKKEKRVRFKIPRRDASSGGGSFLVESGSQSNCGCDERTCEDVDQNTLDNSSPSNDQQ